MDDAEKKRVLRFMELTQQKRIVVKVRAQYFYCEVQKSFTAWENQPYNDLNVTEIPEPIQFT